MIYDLNFDELKKLFTRDKPFGPTRTEAIRNKDIADVIFDRENKLYKALNESPSIILGRRGSGKTAYLGATHHKPDNAIIIAIKQQDLFLRAFASIEPIVKKVAIPEVISDIWRTLLLLTTFQSIANLGFPLPKTKDYLAKAGIRDQERVEDILWNLAEEFAERAKDKPIGLISLTLKTIDNTTFSDAYEECCSILKRQNKNVLILLDSLEEYAINIPTMTHAMRGLLKCVGEFNDHDDFFQIRFCLPAEIYHTLLEISCNPHKDFDNAITLHWHPRELLHIAARRILIYLQIYEPDRFASLSEHDPDQKDGAKKIIYSVFPTTLTNGLGFSENTLAYLFRHTQLLPRQFLRILNRISCASRLSSGEIMKFNGENVVSGVAAIEEQAVAEICSGFGAAYPMARQTCESMIRELPFTFSHGDLHRTFSQYGTKSYQSREFDSCKRMLIEIGAIGRVLYRTERYTHGLFEYTQPHKLAVSHDDELCLHPLFAGAFGSTCAKDKKTNFTIYPYGADMDTEDWRDG